MMLMLSLGVFDVGPLIRFDIILHAELRGSIGYIELTSAGRLISHSKQAG